VKPFLFSEVKIVSLQGEEKDANNCIKAKKVSTVEDQF
jgi:hypothetical protein